MITIHTNISMQIWQIKDLQQFFINRRKPIKALRQRRKQSMANVLQTSYMLDTTLREKRCNVELSVWTQITMLPLTQFSNKCELLQVNFSVKLAEPLVSILRQFQMPSTPLKKIESGHMIDTLQMQQFLLRTLLKKSNLHSPLIQFH